MKRKTALVLLTWGILLQSVLPCIAGEGFTDVTVSDGYYTDENGAWVSDARNYLGIDFSAEDIAYIDFYMIPVPVAAKVKHIVKEEDIAFIYHRIDSCRLDREKNYSPLVGGIDYLNFVKKDGTNIVLGVSSPFVSYKQQIYRLRDEFLPDELWKMMEYDELSVSQEAYSAMLDGCSSKEEQEHNIIPDFDAVTEYELNLSSMSVRPLAYFL